jgi:radical SAM superfamily enzyme YgiQ (UPF0313 family)
MYHSIIFNVVTMMNKRPPGAHRIASFLREQDWDVEVLDWAPFFSLDELKEFARSRINKNTVFLGFSCFFSHWDDNLEAFTTWCKQEYPNVKIVLGMASVPKMKVKAADYYVYGYGENALMALVQNFIGNSTTGIKLDPKFLASGRKIINGNDFYPAFPLKSLMIKYEDRDYLESTEWLGIEFSRGCMFECLYCNFPVLGVKGDYSRDADDYVLQMQDTYDRFGVTSYYVADETFNDRSEKIIKFSEASNKLNFKPILSGFIRADLLVSRKQDWEHLLNLGLVGHFYGVETFNHKAAKTIGKGMNPQKLQEGLLEAQQYFKNNDRGLYRATIALIVGLPFETKESLDQARQWIYDNWKDESVDFTPLEIPYDEYNDKLSKLSKDWKKFNYVNQPGEPVQNIREWITVKHSIKNLNWKNEEMDLSYAYKFSNDAHKLVNQYQGIHNFNLDWGRLCGFSDKETFDIKQYKLWENDQILSKSWESRFQRYKNKKI